MLYDQAFIKKLPPYDGEQENPLVVALCRGKGEWGRPLRRWVEKTYLDFENISSARDAKIMRTQLHSRDDKDFLSGYFELAVLNYLQQTGWKVKRGTISGAKSQKTPDFLVSKGDRNRLVMVEVRALTWRIRLHSGTTGITDEQYKQIYDAVYGKIGKYSDIDCPLIIALCVDCCNYGMDDVLNALAGRLCSVWDMQHGQAITPVRIERNDQGLLTPKPEHGGEYLAKTDSLTGLLFLKRTSNTDMDVIHRVRYLPYDRGIHPLQEDECFGDTDLLVSPRVPDPDLDWAEGVTRNLFDKSNSKQNN